MKTLAGEKASEAVLRVSWLNKLPRNIQGPLRVQTQTSLDDLAKTADILFEYSCDAAVKNCHLIRNFDHVFAARQDLMLPQEIYLQRIQTFVTTIKDLVLNLENVKLPVTSLRS
ncbi:hypothetical protein ABEB36_012853 [Hypothenemus hampei]|uniref:Uncharacterized protein n=1 Tax=Hypothenemus hampei TaxID=57062 RepID=A0ABD1E836_HYPHA